MKPYMKNPVIVAILIFAGAVSAGMRTDPQPVHLSISPHENPSRPADDCSIVYYNVCSGWIWSWSPFHSEEVGVVFDLPADCDKEPGEEYTHTEFWWYWRNTHPGYGWTVDYEFWDLDDNWCKIGTAVGSLAGQDPVERWNCYPGLGSTTADFVAITVTMFGPSPYWITDHNVGNSNAPNACMDWPGPGTSHSFYFGGFNIEYCPPYDLFHDPLGPTQLLMDASFSSEVTSIKPASWGMIKSLFR